MQSLTYWNTAAATISLCIEGNLIDSISENTYKFKEMYDRSESGKERGAKAEGRTHQGNNFLYENVPEFEVRIGSSV